MNHWTPSVAVALFVVSASASCNQKPLAEVTPNQPTKTEGAAPAKAAAHPGHGEQSEGQEPSDLDRPLSELSVLSCEHGRKTYECDDCRYEAGFMRVPTSIIEGGLVSTTKMQRQKVAVPIALTGGVRFDERRVGHVSSQVEGIVKRVHVALGDQVKKGQPLLEIESVAVGEGQAAYKEAEGQAVPGARFA